MNRLISHGRPWVVFEPENKDHRKWFEEFQRKATWGHCPVRFFVSDDNGDLVTMIQRKLIKYYVDKEFANSLKRNDNKSKRQTAKTRKV